MGFEGCPLGLNLFSFSAEKKDDMNRFALPILLLLMTLYAGSVTGSPEVIASTSPQRPTAADARAVLNVQEQYFKDRTSSKWEAIYERQHPKLKEIVTLEFFINRYGLAGYDTPDMVKQRASGPLSIMPPPPDIITIPRDGLGFPTTRRYRIIPNPWVRIDRHRYESVGISPDGRWARVNMKLDVTEKLPPNLFKVDMVIPHTRQRYEYWEKVDGRWVVALMVHRLSISGSKIPVTFIPQNIEELDAIDWVEFDPKQLNTQEAEHE